MANPQHIEWLLEGVEAWNERREEDDFVPDFENANIYEAFNAADKLDDLGRFDLIQANLTEADLTRANLFLADLTDSRVRSIVLKMTSGTSPAEAIFTDLSNSHFLTQKQVDSMAGDTGTILRDHINRPAHWPDWRESAKPPEKQFDPALPFVFISYSAEDRDQVREVRRFLFAEGINCWWDQDILPGQKWRQEISHQLEAASAVFTLWTKASTKSDPVIEEATFAQKQGKLVHGMLEPVTLPRFFGETQWVDLRSWELLEEAQITGGLKTVKDERIRFALSNLLLGLRAKLEAYKATDLRQKTPLGGEKLAVTDKGKVSRDTAPLDKAALYTNALKRVHDILQLAKGGNGLKDDSDIVQQLEQALVGSAGDALFVHDIFAEMRVELARAVEDGWLPNTMQIRQLYKALEKSALDIRISQDHVAETLAARAEMRLQTAEEEDIAAFHSNYPVMLEIAESSLAQDLNKDKAKIDNRIQPADASKADKAAAEEEALNATYRTAHRAAEMRQLAGEAGDKLKNTTDVVKRLDTLVDIFTKWFGF